MVSIFKCDSNHFVQTGLLNVFYEKKKKNENIF